MQRFHQAMVGWGDVTGKGMLPKVFPWASLPQDTVICDVGGGNGHATVGLLKAFPHLKIIVQDLPAVVEQGKKVRSHRSTRLFFKPTFVWTVLAK